MTQASRFKLRAWCNRHKVMHRGLIALDTTKGEAPGNVDWVLMQSTGLLDSEGVEIYEGDIVRTESVNSWTFDGVITWDEQSACFTRVGKRFWNDDPYEDGGEIWKGIGIAGTTIIGNIYENPELLEPAK